MPGRSLRQNVVRIFDECDFSFSIDRFGERWIDAFPSDQRSRPHALEKRSWAWRTVGSAAVAKEARIPVLTSVCPTASRKNCPVVAVPFQSQTMVNPSPLVIYATRLIRVRRISVVLHAGNWNSHVAEQRRR